MTRAATYILFPGATWRVGIMRGEDFALTEIPAAGDAPMSELAGQVAKFLFEAGYSGEGMMLALRSSWCFAASISIADLPPNDLKAMLYRLEEKLPVAAETVVADFCPRRAERAGPSLESVLGVCTRLDRARALVDSLEAAGVRVRCIAPAALLAVQAIKNGADLSRLLLLLGDDDAGRSTVNVVVFDRGLPKHWTAVPANCADVKLQLDLLALEANQPLAIEAIGIDSDLQAALAESTQRPITGHPGEMYRLAVQTAVEIAAGRTRPWIDLRHGPLAMSEKWLPYRGSLNVLLASALAMLLVGIGVMSFRAMAYDGIRRASEQKMIDAFRERFPGWAVPTNVRAVVESEHRRTSAGRGLSLPTEASRSALVTLREVLNGLPGDSRFTLGRMTIEDSAFEIEGRVRSYENVDAIAAAARASGMDVPPPQTRKDSEGFWTFTLRGTRPTKPAPQVARGPS